MSDEYEARVAKQAERAKTLSKQDAAIRRTVLRTLMSEPKGRRFIWLELERSHVNSMSISFGDFDGYARTAFLEGERNVGQQLAIEITSQFPKEYVQMLLENSTNKELEDE